MSVCSNSSSAINDLGLEIIGRKEEFLLTFVQVEQKLKALLQNNPGAAFAAPGLFSVLISNYR
jgi:hypothetical protein